MVHGECEKLFLVSLGGMQLVLRSCCHWCKNWAWKFWELKYFKENVERKERMRGEWKDDNSIRVLFDCGENNKRRKRPEQLIWEKVYWKSRQQYFKLFEED